MNSYFLKIDTWYGRLGNNVQQIGNALLLADLCQIPLIETVPHPVLGRLHISLQESLLHDLRPFSSNFFHWSAFTDERTILVPYDYIVRNMSIFLKKFLLPILAPIFDAIPAPSEDIVVHIRSGDIFSKHPGSVTDFMYTPNPACFYESILTQFNTALIVTEPNWTDNPIIKHLITLFPHIRLQSSDVLTDFITLAKSSRLVTSGVGTFAIAAAMLNNHLESLYFTDLYLAEHLNPNFINHNHVHCHCVKLNNYCLIRDGWLNTIEQRKYLFDYKFL